MRYFTCADINAGCDKVFRGLDDGGIVERASEHFANEHPGADAGAIAGAISNNA